METFFTADTHLGHANIMRHAQRPFEKVEDMDACIAKSWNDKVKQNDLVYVLGDFCFKNHKHWIEHLNGRKILILGNHDRMNANDLRRFERVEKLLDISLQIDKDIRIPGGTRHRGNQGFPITLCHYPMMSWNKSCHGALHLYGHCHGRIHHPGRALDVGIDANEGWGPISWREIQEKMVRKIEDENHGNNQGL